MEEKTKELIKKRITLCLVYNDYNVAWVTTDENAETIDVEETLKMIKENSEKYEEQMRNEKN
ncbi:MAG: hypothetical protein IAF38_08275 [Bacteroidia bacterium]|nr:hypothetical protein [Bacteroidia bacterium]